MFLDPFRQFVALVVARESLQNEQKLDAQLLQPFNGLFSRTTWVSRYQKGKTHLDLNEARDDGVLSRAFQFAIRFVMQIDLNQFVL